MRTLTCSALIILVVLCVPQLNGQASRVPYDPDFGPGFWDLYPNYFYPGIHKSMKDVDFEDSAMLVFGKGGGIDLKAGLHKGQFERTVKTGYDSVKLDAVYNLPAGGSITEYAVVLCTWFSARGSSATTGIAQVFELREGRLMLVQQLEWDEHVETNRPFAVFDPASYRLIICVAHYLPGDSHCCVSAVDVVTLRWSKSKFIRKTVRTDLSEYGISAGKKI